MTPEEVHESRDLLSAHNALRWNLARNGDRFIGLFAHDDDEKTSQPCLSPSIGRQVMLVSLALVEARLAELGVTPEHGLDRDCFECNGSGKQPMKKD